AQLLEVLRPRALVVVELDGRLGLGALRAAAGRKGQRRAGRDDREQAYAPHVHVNLFLGGQSCDLVATTRLTSSRWRRIRCPACSASPASMASSTARCSS